MCDCAGKLHTSVRCPNSETPYQTTLISTAFRLIMFDSCTDPGRWTVVCTVSMLRDRFLSEPVAFSLPRTYVHCQNTHFALFSLNLYAARKWNSCSAHPPRLCIITVQLAHFLWRSYHHEEVPFPREFYMLYRSSYICMHSYAHWVFDQIVSARNFSKFGWHTGRALMSLALIAFSMPYRPPAILPRMICILAWPSPLGHSSSAIL